MSFHFFTSDRDFSVEKSGLIFQTGLFRPSPVLPSWGGEGLFQGQLFRTFPGLFRDFSGTFYCIFWLLVTYKYSTSAECLLRRASTDLSRLVDVFSSLISYFFFKSIVECLIWEFNR